MCTKKTEKFTSKKISELIKRLQKIQDDFGDTCVSFNQLDWGACALNHFYEEREEITALQEKVRDLEEWQRDGITLETQNRIRDLVVERSGADDSFIDGGGCDSGDPVDLTLDEIGMGFNILLDKIEEQRQWVADLQSRRYVNCVYCGKRYPPGTPSKAEILKEHIRFCAKHPMRTADEAVSNAVKLMKRTLLCAKYINKENSLPHDWEEHVETIEAFIVGNQSIKINMCTAAWENSGAKKAGVTYVDFSFGYFAANQWTKITGPDDLPKNSKPGDKIE